MTARRQCAPLDNGVGAVTHPDGRRSWRVVYRVGGKVHTRAGFQTKGAARAWQARNRVAVDTGMHVAPAGGLVLFGDWCARWATTRIDLRPSTRARDDSYLRNYLMPTFGALPLRRIDHPMITDWIAALCGRGLAPATVTKAYQILGKVMRAAVSAKLIAQSPCMDVTLPAPRDEEARFLTPDELVYLEDALPPYWCDVVPFLADTGLRIGEAAALRWRDVDTLRGTVTVRETLVEVPAALTVDGTGVTIGPPKTRAGLRTVPTLTDETAARLVTRRAGAGPDDFVWATPTGAALRPKSWRSRVWRPAVIRAGLADPQPTPHTLRHTAVALWIAAGTTDAFKLQRWAGHRSVTTIYRVYGHLLPTDATEERTALTALRTAARSRVAERKVIALPVR